MLNTIKHQHTGDLVKVAQYLIGFAARKKADGIFSATMVTAVCTWQRRYGLSPDGIVGPLTWAKITDKAPTCSTGKNRTSAATCAIQILLGGLVVDGIYGTKTKKAVAAYQKAKGLKADGICGPKTWSSLIEGSAVEETTEAVDKIINECVHYVQWDSRWRNKKYSTHTSSQTIGNSGCGPTAMAMICAQWVDPKLTPVELCALALENGYRTYDDGTKRDFMKFCFGHFAPAFKDFLRTSNVSTLTAAIQNGALAVCSVNNGDKGFWTSAGHFITVVGFDGTYVYANDPNKTAHPRKQKLSAFKKCMNEAMIFWKNDTSAKAEEPTDNTDVIEEKAIIDISKWQGNVDFDALKPEVSLVIARCSCGSDLDTKFDSYAEAMNRQQIPFGVYCYSYAGDVAKAKDEAQKMVKYAAAYKPLFYVIDAEESKITNDAIAAFVKELRALGVERVGCYVAHNHYKDYAYDTLRGLFDFTWIPRYGKNDGTLAGSTKPNFECDLWQYTSTGKVAGISGNVDMNIITGTGKSLAWFLGKGD